MDTDGAPLQLRLLWAYYAEHATSGQFHSELKPDLDIERLPPGKFPAYPVGPQRSVC
jgi:hypothetical protein